DAPQTHDGAGVDQDVRQVPADPADRNQGGECLLLQALPRVEHKDGTRSMAWAEMKKSIYSLAPLRELLLASNRRYLEFISAIEDDKAGTGKLNKISQPVEENDRSYRGFNFFDPEDEDLFEALGSGEFNISGFQNKDLRRRVEGKNTGQVSRLMKRLRTHGLIKKKNLQVLRHWPWQARHRAWPQTEEPLRDPATLSGRCPLKVLPDSAQI